VIADRGAANGHDQVGTGRLGKAVAQAFLGIAGQRQDSGAAPASSAMAAMAMSFEMIWPGAGSVPGAPAHPHRQGWPRAGGEPR
jgi:hypothetical protein